MLLHKKGVFFFFGLRYPLKKKTLLSGLRCLREEDCRVLETTVPYPSIFRNSAKRFGISSICALNRIMRSPLLTSASKYCLAPVAFS